MARQKAKVLFYTLVFILIGWPVIQMYQLYMVKPDRQNATVMLHQVAVFHMQLLRGVMAEAAGDGSTDRLDSLQQAVYSMQFVHQRLERAVGKEIVIQLAAFTDFLHYVFSLQLSGNRMLRPEEAQVLERMHEYVILVQPIYERLITEEGKVSKLAMDELKQADEEMKAFLEKAALSNR